jgi:signal peptidase II
MSNAVRSPLSRLALLLGVLAIGIGLDQATKLTARATLMEGERHSCCADTARLQLAYNDGAFLSLGGSLPRHTRDLVFRGGVLLVLLGMSVYVLRARDMDDPTLIAFALCIAGGTGNLIDRFVYDGAVLDFLNVGIGGLRTGIFNVADMYIMAGAGALLLLEVRHARTQK